MSVRQLVKRLIPQPLLLAFRRRQLVSSVYRQGKKDLRAYAEFCVQSDRHAAPTSDVRKLETQLTKDYHRVEKGLALGAPKRPFGVDVARRLDRFIPAAAAQGASTDEFLMYAEQARKALRDWNQDGLRSDELSPQASEILNPNPVDVEMFAGVIEGRRSVRHFDVSRKVEKEILERAVTLAGNTPSVCNRQPWAAHVFTGRDPVRRVLSFQNGNRAFRDELHTVIVITVDARLFAGAEERNQPWIEGGLFAAHLSLSLRAMGVATCLLNMSVDHSTMDGLRRSSGIAKHEMVVMMMAVGYPARDHRIARSPRRPVEHILRVHEEERSDE